MVIELDTNRNAIYKTLFDARRKLRTALVANGYLGTRSAPEAAHERQVGTRSLSCAPTPLDAGCGETMERLDVYAELTLADVRRSAGTSVWERT